MMAIDLMFIQPGWKVTDAEGRELGLVGEVDPGYLKVVRGAVSAEDYYLPDYVVDWAHDGVVTLRISSYRLPAFATDEPPTEGQVPWSELPEEFKRVEHREEWLAEQATLPRLPLGPRS